MKKLLSILACIITINSFASYILVPMDNTQKNHLKAYGIAFWVLQNEVEVQWLLNYRGGSFLFQHNKKLALECTTRDVSFETIPDAQATAILEEISNPEVNQDAIKLEKVPRMAVYSPKGKQPWDDAVTLVLTYAEIPYDIIYDEEILSDVLPKYDWLHLHHEDFTGQYGRFYSGYKNAAWYQEEVKRNEEMAKKLGFAKVSEMKLAVAKKIRDYCFGGGFLFAMCSAADSYDVALSAEGIDICAEMFDHDGADPDMNKKIDYAKCFAFENFTLYQSLRV